MKIFIIPFRVRRMNVSIMPENFSGACVSCYSAGGDYIEATKKALEKLAKDGLHPEEILQPIHEMDSDNWSKHIFELWPDQAGHLPSQNEFEDIIKKGGVIYGPFGSYA